MMSENVKHVHICCDGSFGNRYSGLIGGITLARLCNLPVKVSWPSTNMCRARFYELFSTENNLEAYGRDFSAAVYTPPDR